MAPASSRTSRSRGSESVVSLLSEDFEGYAVGGAPGGEWVVEDNGSTGSVAVDDARAASGSNSLLISQDNTGSPSNWVVTHPVSVPGSHIAGFAVTIDGKQNGGGANDWSVMVADGDALLWHVDYTQGTIRAVDGEGWADLVAMPGGFASTTVAYDAPTDAYTVTVDGEQFGPFDSPAGSVDDYTRFDTFRVRADNWRGAIDAIDVTDGSATFPTVPTDLTVARNAGDYDLTWTSDGTNTDGFRVYESTDGGETFAQVGADLPPAARSYSTPAPANALATYYIGAFNAGIQRASQQVSIQSPGFVSPDLDVVEMPPTAPTGPVTDGEGPGAASAPPLFLTNARMGALTDMTTTAVSNVVESGAGQGPGQYTLKTTATLANATMDGSSVLGEGADDGSTVGTQTGSGSETKQGIPVTPNSPSSSLNIEQSVQKGDADQWPITVTQTVVLDLADVSKLDSFDATIESECAASVKLTSVSQTGSGVELTVTTTYECGPEVETAEGEVQVTPTPKPGEWVPTIRNTGVRSPRVGRGGGSKASTGDWQWRDDYDRVQYTYPPRLNLNRQCQPVNEQARVGLSLHYGGAHAEPVGHYETLVSYDPSVLSFDGFDAPRLFTPGWEFTESFEAGLGQWTGDVATTTDRAYDGETSLLLDWPRSHREARYTFDEPRQPTSFEFVYQEGNQTSHGFGMRLHNSNGDVEWGAATDNPQWVVHDAAEGDGYGGAHDTLLWDPADEFYNEWVRVEATFDWSTDPPTHETTFTRLSTGETRSKTGALRQGVDIQDFRPQKYNTGATPAWNPDGNLTQTWVDSIKATEPSDLPYDGPTEVFPTPEVIYHDTDAGLLKFGADDPEGFEPWRAGSANRLCDILFTPIGETGTASPLHFVETFDQYLREESPYRGWRPTRIEMVGGGRVPWRTYFTRDEWRPYRFGNGGVTLGNGINVGSADGVPGGVVALDVSAEVATEVSGFNLSLAYPGEDAHRPFEFVDVVDGDLGPVDAAPDDQIGVVTVSADREAADVTVDDPLLCRLLLKPGIPYGTSTPRVRWVGGDLYDVDRGAIPIDCDSPGSVGVANTVQTQPSRTFPRAVEVTRSSVTAPDSPGWPLVINEDYTVTGILAAQVEEMLVDVTSETNPDLETTVNEVTLRQRSATANVTIVIPRADDQQFPVRFVPSISFVWGNQMGFGGGLTIGGGVSQGKQPERITPAGEFRRHFRL